MPEKAESRLELLLLLSLVLVIPVYPALDHGEVRRVVLGALMFVPVILALRFTPRCRLAPSALVIRTTVQPAPSSRCGRTLPSTDSLE